MQTWLFVLTGAALLAAPADARSYSNPIQPPHGELGAGIADPGVLRWMGRYYLYATKVTEDEGLRCWESGDLVRWRYLGYCLGNDPALDHGMAWNPAPFYFNGRFYLYVCGPDQKHKVFAADHPAGPFECVNPDLLDVPSLDAQPFLEDDGRLHVTYAGWGGIQYRECSSPVSADGSNHQLTSCRVNAQDTNEWTEGSDLVKIDGVYYLSYCGNDWKSDNYQVHAARGRSIAALEPQANNPVISQVAGPWVATGCSHVVRGPDLKSRWAVYHCRQYGGVSRKLCLDRVFIDPDTADLRVDGPTWTPRPAPAYPDWEESFAGSGLGLSWKRVSGTWTAGGGHVAVSHDAGERRAELLTTFPTGRDFAAEFNFRAAGEPEGGRARIGVALCEHGGRRMEALVDPVRRSLELVRPGSPAPLARASLPRWFDPSRWHTLFVEKRSDRLRLYVDGMLKIEISTDGPGGQLGLITSGCAAEFGWCGFSNMSGRSASVEGLRDAQLLAETPLADPHVVRDEAGWAVFGTAAYLLYGGDIASGGFRPLPLEIDFGEGSPAFQVWAFSPYAHSDGSWHAYATVHYGHYRTAVGHFVPWEGQQWRPGSPITKWRLSSVLVGTNSEDGPFAYDGRAFRDDDGALYLIYSTSSGRHRDVSIQAVRLSDPGAIDPAFPPRTLLGPEGYRSEDRNPGYIQLVESPGIVRVGKKWAMLYSVGDFAADNYKLGVAYSDRLIPAEGSTYEKVLIPDQDDLWGSGRGREVCYLLQSEKPGWPNYCAHAVRGAGAGSVVSDGGRYWLVFHGYTPEAAPGSGRFRHVWRLPVEIDPTASGPMREWLRVSIPFQNDFRHQ